MGVESGGELSAAGTASGLDVPSELVSLVVADVGSVAVEGVEVVADVSGVIELQSPGTDLSTVFSE